MENLKSLSWRSVAILLALFFCAHVSALQSTATSTATARPSGGWRVALNIGREPFTTMPNTWAASGARFPLVMKCNFTDDGKVGSISGDVRFTGRDGEVITPVQSGTWSLSNNRDLSFTLVFPERIERNGVAVGPCTIICEGLLYSKKDLGALDQDFYQVRSVTDQANAEVKEATRRREAPKKWNFETNLWEKRYKKESIASNIANKLKLFLAEKDEQTQSTKRPNPLVLSIESGEFPGIDCEVFIGKGGKLKMKGGLLSSDCVIGTWGAEPINDNAASYYRPSY